MNRYTISPTFLFLALFLVVVQGCGRKTAAETIDLPPTPVLAVKVAWGVVKSPYLRMREAPKLDAAVKAPLHQSSVVEILSKSSEPELVENKRDYWYQVNYAGLRGWVFGSYLDLFDSREKAESSMRERRQ